MPIDWDGNVLAPLFDIFGQAVTYAPAAGASFPITGVFDEAYREVDLAGGMAVTTDMPVMGVRLAEFTVPPAQGDTLTVDSLNWVFIVKECRPDGHGYAKLMLNYLSP